MQYYIIFDAMACVMVYPLSLGFKHIDHRLPYIKAALEQAKPFTVES